ncbi:MAG: hypothetical protein ABW101_18315, partial [Candidatus Thiodiazotropha sp.]
LMNGGEITANQAMALSMLYQQKYIALESTIGQPVDKGDYWETVVYVGVAGVPSGTIRIDKMRGSLSSNLGPTIDDPATLVKKP